MCTKIKLSTLGDSAPIQQTCGLLDMPRHLERPLHKPTFEDLMFIHTTHHVSAEWRDVVSEVHLGVFLKFVVRFTRVLALWHGKLVVKIWVWLANKL